MNDSDNFGWLTFLCSVCGATQRTDATHASRETAICDVCGSTVRWRSLISVLTTRLFGRPLSIAEWPSSSSQLVGLGMSDWHGYADRLPEVCKYVNTWYDRDPALDILDPPVDTLASCDFVICSDVLEHVPAPVDRAFLNLRRILRPGGVLVMTVPYVPTGSTVEHFGPLHEFRVVDGDGGPVLRDVLPDGSTREFRDLVFHGGDGLTLEMRVFSLPDLLQQLEVAGFADVQVHDSNVYRHGVMWDLPWSLPITARAGNGTSFESDSML